ncbi:MAG: response regulator [Thermodesulfobacteriota bacterium]
MAMRDNPTHEQTAEWLRERTAMNPAGEAGPGNKSSLPGKKPNDSSTRYGDYVWITAAAFLGLASLVLALSILLRRIIVLRNQLRQSQQALRASEETLKLTLEATNDGVWDWNIPSGTVAVNARYYEMLGYEASEYSATYESLTRLVHPLDLARAEAKIRAHVEGKERSYTAELRMRTKSGDWAWILSRGKVVERNSQGDALRMVGTHTDITPLKRLEQDALRNSEHRYRELFERMSSGVAVYEAVEEGEDFVFKDLNSAGEKIERIRRADIIGKRVTEAFPGAREFGILGVLRHVWRTGQHEYLPARMYRDERDHGSWRENWVYKIASGEIVAIYNDVTDRQRAEESLALSMERLELANQDLEAAIARATELTAQADIANQAKSDFLARMSHEIRTPLNAIVGMTELALSTELTPEQRSYLKAVSDSADKLIRLIGDILDFSKIEAGKLDIVPVSFSLRECVFNAVAPHSLQAADKRLELVAQVAPDVPDGVIGDPVRLNQVLSNLVANAVKFTDKGEVALEVVSDARTPEHVVLHFSIHDTGVGVRPEHHDRIFSPFEQAERPMTRKHGGAGLGLAICRQIVQLMDGRIWLESRHGVGSTFHVTLSLGLQSPASQPTCAAGASELAGLRVLVVDDNATSRAVLEALLAGWGMQSSSRTNGLEALEELRTAIKEGRPYELAILDAVMPEMGGFETAEAMRKDRALETTPVIILGFARRQSDSDLRNRLGLTSVLPKPVNPPLLLNAMCARGPRGSSGHSAFVDKQDYAFPVSERPARILLVEDQAAGRRLAEMMLKKMGHRVTVARHGRESLSLLGKDAFDLILMDVEMPEMDGVDATGKIRELEKGTGHHVPIIAMTAHALPGDRDRYLGAGMDGYLAKPIRAADLSAVIDQFSREARMHPGDADPQLPENAADDRIAVGPTASATTGDEPGWSVTESDENAGQEAPGLSGRGSSVHDGSAREEKEFTPGRPGPSAAEARGLPETVPGIAVRTALENLQCDEQFFMELLRDFSRDSRHAAANISASWEHHDVAETRRLVHSIKGVSGNLSATGLHEAAQGLEEALVRGDEEAFPRLFDAFDRELSVVLRSIDCLAHRPESDSRCRDTSANEPEKTAGTDLSTVLRNLSRLLRSHDTESFVLADELAPLLSSRAHSRQLEDLQTCLQRLDFSGAHKALSKLAYMLDASLDREHE